MTPRTVHTPLGEAIPVDYDGMRITVVLGTSNPNCLCLDGRTPGCPQHPQEPTTGRGGDDR